MRIEIDTLRLEYAARFAELNRAWLEEYGLMEHSEAPRGALHHLRAGPRRPSCDALVLSNSQLQQAIRLYESMGFTHRPVPAVTKYEIADVYMVLDLGVIDPG
jgi:hypothetical protein